MAITRTEVFVASRFDEFAAVRAGLRERLEALRTLPLEVVDFADGRMSPHPPLEACLAAVKRAEIMVLLVGSSYGDAAPGRRKGEEAALSYTHLEYRQAIKRRSAMMVLPFVFVDPSRQEPEDPRMAAFQQELKAKHICKNLAKGIEPDAAVEHIVLHTLRFFLELRSGAGAEGGEDETDWDGGVQDDERQLSSTELDWLEASQNRRSGRPPRTGSARDDGERVESLLRQPARAAAAEQLAMAFDALQMSERTIAVRHLRRALEHDPLNGRASYWLARVLATTGQLAHRHEAVRLADRAARVAENEGSTILAAASRIVAARCSSDLDDNEAGLRYAREACAGAGWFARAHLELAAQLALAGRADEATREIRNAFNLFPRSIYIADRDPDLRTLGPKYDEVRAQIRRTLEQRLERLEELARKTRASFALPAPADGSASAGRGVVELSRALREAGLGQLQLVRAVASQVLERGRQLRRSRARLSADQGALGEEQARHQALLRRRLLEGSAVAAAALAALVLTPILGLVVGVAAGGVLARALGPWRLLQRTRERLAALQQNVAEMDKGQRQLTAALEAFKEHAVEFERAVMNDPLASPVGRGWGAGPGDVLAVRVDKDGPVLHAEPPLRPDGDWALIPPALRSDQAIHVESPPSHPCLVRVSAGNTAEGKRRVVRWGAYFTAAPDPGQEPPAAGLS